MKLEHFERFRRDTTTVHFAISNGMTLDNFKSWVEHRDEDDLRTQGFCVYCQEGDATEKIPQFIEIIQRLRPTHAVQFVPNIPEVQMNLILQLVKMIGYYEGVDNAENN